MERERERESSLRKVLQAYSLASIAFYPAERRTFNEIRKNNCCISRTIPPYSFLYNGHPARAVERVWRLLCCEFCSAVINQQKKIPVLQIPALEYL